MPPVEVRVFRDGNGKVPFNDWLRDLKKKQKRAHARCIYLLMALSREGRDLKMPHAKPLRDGVMELRGRVGKVNYRPLFALISNKVAAVSHGLTKEREVPSDAIDLAVARIALMKSDPDRYTADVPRELMK